MPSYRTLQHRATKFYRYWNHDASHHFATFLQPLRYNHYRTESGETKRLAADFATPLKSEPQETGKLARHEHLHARGQAVRGRALISLERAGYHTGKVSTTDDLLRFRAAEL
jgi:hypothetical protein